MGFKIIEVLKNIDFKNLLTKYLERYVKTSKMLVSYYIVYFEILGKIQTIVN